MSDDWNSSDYSGAQTNASSAEPYSGGKGLLKKKMEKRKKADAGSASSSGEDIQSSAKAIASFKRGTRRVPKTGIYKLHSGEAVLNRSQAKSYRKRSSRRGSK
jgi:hypothetical protein